MIILQLPAACVALRTMPHLIANLPSETDSIHVGGSPLLIWRPMNAEKLVLETSQTDFGDDERLPYWAILWPASIALGNHVAGLPQLAGKRVLEIGAGLGVAGLAAARAGAAVTVSDWYPDCLEFVQSSARLNGIVLETAYLDWRFPPEEAPFDYIIGADLLYERRNHAPILDCVERLLAHDGKLLLSDPQRHPGRPFFELARDRGWEMEFTHESAEVDGAIFTVNCWTLWR